MARVFKFAQKEFGISSELLTLKGQGVSSFTYNTYPVLTTGNYGGAEQIETIMTGQTLANGAAATALLFSNTLTPVSTHGITIASSVITLTKKGLYTFKVQCECNIGCVLKVAQLLNTVSSDSANFQSLAVAGGNVSANFFFELQKTTTGSTAIAFTIQGDSAPTTGTDVIVSNAGEIKIVFYPSAVQ